MGLREVLSRLEAASASASLAHETPFAMRTFDRPPPLRATVSGGLGYHGLGYQLSSS